MPDSSSTIDGKSGVAYLTDTSYISNSATSQGGAIYNSALGTTNSYAILNVNDSVFTSNSAIGEGASGEGFGGAIYNGANGVIYSEDTLYPSTIIDHLDIHAGVLPTELTAGSLSINSSLFQNNTAFTSGGAIYNAGSGGVELIDVDLIGNSAINGVGGAVYTAGNNISVLADVKDVQIYGNSANGKSNANYVGGTGSALIGLGANASRVLSLNDTIMTNSFDTTFQINENAQVGTIVFGEEFGVLKADGSFGASSYVLNAGEVKIANSDKFSHISALSSLNLSTHTTINTINNSIQDLTLENFSVQGVTPVVNLALDMGYDEIGRAHV